MVKGMYTTEQLFEYDYEGMFEGMYSVEIGEHGWPVLKIDYDAIENSLELECQPAVEMAGVSSAFPEGVPIIYSVVKARMDNGQMWGVRVPLIRGDLDEKGWNQLIRESQALCRDKVILSMVSRVAQEAFPDLDWTKNVVENL